MEKVPEEFSHIGDVMSNFDHTVEDGMDERLKSGKLCGDYAGWNFHGTVWFDKVFKCQVMVYGCHHATIEADSLKGLMEAVSNEFGYD